MMLEEVEEELGVFFFQAEDGIRDYDVTGVQTCALPIYVADAAITIGVVIVLARAFFMGDKDKAEVDGLMNSKAADAAESK